MSRHYRPRLARRVRRRVAVSTLVRRSRSARSEHRGFRLHCLWERADRTGARLSAFVDAFSLFTGGMIIWVVAQVLSQYVLGRRPPRYTYALWLPTLASDEQD